LSFPPPSNKSSRQPSHPLVQYDDPSVNFGGLTGLCYSGKLKLFTYTRRILFLIVLALAGLLLISCREQYSAVKAFEIISESEDIDEIVDAEKSLSGLAATRDWGLVETGAALLRLGKPDLATNYYSKVKASSSASLDSRLGLLRAQLKLKENSGSPDSLDNELSLLEAQSSSAKRPDLLPSIYLTRAKLLSENGRHKEATAYLHQLCKDYSSSREFDEGFELLKKSDLDPGIATLSEWSELLSRARRYEESISLTEKAVALAPENSKAQLELLSKQERSLRRSGKQELADELLNRLASSSTAGIADKALLNLGLNAWNKNKHQAALDWFEKIEPNFPKSSLLSRVNYLRGRVLEEMKNFPEALKVYQKTISSFEKNQSKRSSGSEREYYLKAAKRLPWIDVINNDRKRARGKMKRLSEQAKSLEDSTLEQHANFWKNPPEVNQSKISLSLEDVNFYSIQNGTLQLKSPEDSCQVEIDEKLEDKLSALSKLKVRGLASREINWAFQGVLPSSDNPWQVKDLEKSLAIARLHAKYADPSDSIRLATLAAGKKQKNPELAGKCNASLQRLLYPSPFIEEYKSNAKKYRLRPSLLLAISRTESHFNPEAVSPVGARGVMQLMSATAKKEGLKEGQSLFDPLLNVSLGSKHFSRLLDIYDGEEIYAIAAYNAGSEAVNRWIKRYPGLSPLEWSELIGYPETLNYVKKVSSAAVVYQQILKSQSKPPETGQSQP